MKRMNGWSVAGLIVATAQLAGCQKQLPHQEYEHPARVEHVDGSEISRVTLTEHAMKRLDVQTAKVTMEQSPRQDSMQKTIPYSALLYDPQGKTWVYTNPNPRVFVRKEIDVDFIEGGKAYLIDGPEPGTEVASVGVAELYGTEFEVGH